ncbi:DUF1800 domain-containing protein [Plastoroseomonas hellenica]|uniref:DUF1800 domain-containing protein n=1 Tax=Plastoroseomonas hellenica TaxID=2687306 RepID=UPI001BA4BF3E|nr:DUF1800 domain-containing protein [Plastoroseomonas hellenica]MBR0646259.1 DUF1800 domain-containing protein [Plastoroseomonas hellenica]
MQPRAAIAAIRFGLGRRPGEPVPGDPEAWLTGQLQAAPLPEEGPDLPDFAEIAAAFAEDRNDRVALAAAAEPPPVQAMARIGPPRAILLEQAEQRAQAALLLTTETPFRERLVSFWANHFAINARRGPVVGAHAGHMLRTAIRPHVTGPFATLLEAAVLHPAMLAYLDNTQSVGPNSRAGRGGRLGLNENLARELMELHTLSPAAGYSQADVTEMARILTGWTVRAAQPPGGAVFLPNRHEPGEKTVLGRRFEAGEAAVRVALRFLADHSATHRHIAAKLVRHFVADDPPPGAIRRVEGVLRDTGGDLGAASAALVATPEAWEAPLSKLRSPQDYVVAVLRAVGSPPPMVGSPPPPGQAVPFAMGLLGQPLWQVPAPDGWPDTAPAWTAPEAMLRRVEWAHGVAGRFARLNARDLAAELLGPLAAPATLAELARAGSARDALTLLLTSPEFQRR